MRILVSSSRMPYALDEIRKLGRSGHEVHAVDTFAAAPGSRSRYVADWHVTPSPRYSTRAFVERFREIVHEHDIDLVIPTFEEVFHLRAHDELFADVPIMAPPFEVLAKLHDKVRFMRFAEELGFEVPRGVVAHSREELHACVHEFERYFARPAFGRAGVSLLTNAGPLAGALTVDDCNPTRANPWLVQEYVHGIDVCGFSVVRHGQVTAHAAYVHPKTIESAGGIVFESITDPDTLVVAERVAEATGYHGQLSFDFKRADDGRLVIIECNPRATAGVCVMPRRMFVAGMFDPVPTVPEVAPAGRRRIIRAALVRNMLLHWRDIGSDLADILSSTPDVYFNARDVGPGLFQFLSLVQLWDYRRRERPAHDRSLLLAGYLHDATWDGEPMR